MAMHWKIVLAGAIIALSTGTASAQGGPQQPEQPSPFAPTKEQLEERKRNDAAYQEAIKKIPNAPKKQIDPWGDVRSTAPTAGANK
jgi:hypothetical protein